MQLDSERIADFKAAQGLVNPPTPEEAELKAICTFHEERLNWRLQRAFEDCFPGRAFQQPRPVRSRPVAIRPQGFA